MGISLDYNNALVNENEIKNILPFLKESHNCYMKK